MPTDTQPPSGKVALITGAARGQGRAHAGRLAAMGANIVVIDACAPISDAITYPASTSADLAETVRVVEATGQQAIAHAQACQWADRRRSPRRTARRGEISQLDNHNSFNGDRAILAGRLPWEYRDPFDRIKLAQALRRNLTIATRDAKIIDAAITPTLKT